MSVPNKERRRFPRIQAAVVWRPTGLDLFHHQRQVRDLSLAGMRAYSDDELQTGQGLECEVIRPDGRVIRVWGRIAWVAELPPGSVAAREVGIQFTDLDPSDTEVLASLLVRDPA